MPTRRAIVIAAAVCALFGETARADDGSAQAFIAAIYAAYKGKNAKGVRLTGEAALRRYFEPSLATMIVKDEQAAARRKDMPTLDGDPFVDGQDWEIAAVAIAMSNVTDTSATATATFDVVPSSGASLSLSAPLNATAGAPFDVFLAAGEGLAAVASDLFLHHLRCVRVDVNNRDLLAVSGEAMGDSTAYA